MPYAPGVRCRKSGCLAVTTNRDGYCDKHRKEKWKNDRRREERAAVYDWQWKQVEQMYSRLHPLCEDCEERGIVKVRDMVHHIVPIADGGAVYDFSNLRSLCWSCHGRYATTSDYRL